MAALCARSSVADVGEVACGAGAGGIAGAVTGVLVGLFFPAALPVELALGAASGGLFGGLFGNGKGGCGNAAKTGAFAGGISGATAVTGLGVYDVVKAAISADAAKPAASKPAPSPPPKPATTPAAAKPARSPPPKPNEAAKPAAAKPADRRPRHKAIYEGYKDDGDNIPDYIGKVDRVSCKSPEHCVAQRVREHDRRSQKGNDASWNGVKRHEIRAFHGTGEELYSLERHLVDKCKENGGCQRQRRGGGGPRVDHR